MRIRTAFDRSTWLLAGGLGFLAALIALTFLAVDGQRRADVAIDHSMNVQNRLMTVLSSLQDAETGQRGYIITGKTLFLEPYDRTRLNLGADLDNLASATADDAAQRAAMSHVRTLVEARMASLRQGLALRQAGDLTGAADYVARGDSNRRMDEVRREISGMSSEEARVLLHRQVQSRTNFIWLRILLILGFAIVVTLAITALRGAGKRLALVAARRDELATANLNLTEQARSREQAETQVRQLQKMEAVGQLTGGIAHDFNNMLSIVIGSLDLALRRMKKDPGTTVGYIETALEGAHRAAALTARLLAFSRQQPLTPVASDPNKLITGMSDLLRRTIGENLRVETVFSGGMWRICADVSQLENAVLNLCVNARDAMPGGGKLTVETSNAHLDDAYAEQHVEVKAGQYVLISVSDTGTGMTREVVRRAFDPFYTTKPVGKGTGLGLSQVFGFVKQSGGHIEIYSEPGVGTSVKIYLPRWIGGDAEAAAERDDRGAGLPVASNGEVILVVEDDADVRLVSVDALRHLGFTVVQAGSGEEALQVLALQPRVDLLFTDIVMPGMTGRVLADLAIAHRPRLKVLYTTGYTRNAVVHNGILDSGVAFLPKPFTIDQLAHKIARVFADAGAHRKAPELALEPLA
ncbi:CHASE3 domain-containing protein [Phenylobacterium sp.]|uniref:CHASE3 domain-containing protein n=1 Tax=Phenylobacterium sp. TaxID=1871053 RepID=UPI001217BE50|nr:CHASE3 domain-containing protein [Phenylobacterium sp.]THD52528.1 MAG: response regulator [Phenylobacterium sp.]